MEGQRLDWSHDVDGRDIGEDYQYEKIYLEVGESANNALDALSVDLEELPSDEHGWTSADSYALNYLVDIEVLAETMVPPESTPLHNRQRAEHLVRSLRNALPFTGAERWWLLRDGFAKIRQSDSRPADKEYMDPIRNARPCLVSEGLQRDIRGQVLLGKFWSWRREVGEYSGGEGLAQARESLAGLVELLTPDLGLPDSYKALRGDF
jgi:hypothetical protein